MRNSYIVMESFATGLKENDFLFLGLTALVAAGAALVVFAACFYWFRREQRRLQRRILRTITESSRHPDEIFQTGHESMSYGELVAQFKVNQGKQVVSVLESEGKRYIHVEGDLTPNERSKMVRYLKSEGFMS
jgi:hypothetical protein